MKFYLSSFRMGNDIHKLIEMTQKGNRSVAYISNSLDDFTDAAERRRIEGNDISDLEQLGFKVELLDLREYFHDPQNLEERIQKYDVIWVSGGNTFVLRQAMKLSGFDWLIRKLNQENVDMVYGGYSAGVCVLGPTLQGIHLVDDSSQKPYGEQYDVIWDGLGILDYVIVPHYRSEHFESDAIEEVVQYMIVNKILFVALKDGEVIVVE